ncbi:TPA: phosphoadenosine phosphosulfate reductase family protein [Candidatus Woesearchaeota archaeon]|nr:phosphoadenosine phosphosulfate reductase family protein [Candidatus Woesearchaeota archaeon]
MPLEDVIDVGQANAMLENLPAVERVRWAYSTFRTRMVSTTSGGETSAILPHLIGASVHYSPAIIFVDIGYFNKDTHSMIEWLAAKGYDIRTYHPAKKATDIDKANPLWWLDPTTEESKAIINTIKNEPLERAFTEFHPNAWLRGIMRWETPERQNAPFVEFSGGLYRINPIVDWTREQAATYIGQHSLHANPKHYDVTKGQNQNLECGILEAGLH